MALLFSTHLNNKNSLDHFSLDKIPPQFEEVPSTDDDSASSVKKGDAEPDASVITKNTPFSTPKVLREAKKYTEWMLINCALMTWLDASMSITYQNRVVHYATFAEAWETINHIFTASSNHVQAILDGLSDEYDGYVTS
ncbi:hypothetical protein PIB30_064759, partial [Stylosanthes scabra]|nr:hypothetical protein [Stylosanthes scabra]